MKFWALLKKELLDLVRDKKAFIALFMPLFLFPLIYYGLGTQLKNVEKTVGDEIKIYSNIQAHEEKKDIFAEILPEMEFIFVDSTDPEEDLKAEEIYLIVNFLEENIQAFPLSIELVYNANSNYSTAAYSYVSAALESANIQVACTRLLDLGVNLSVLDNIRVQTKELSTNMLLVMLAPMLITSLLVSGGASIAADIFAGEKERGTLEQLVVTQVKRETLLFAKTLVVFIVTLLNACISLFAYYISMKISPDIMQIFGSEQMSFKLSGTAVISLIGTIVMFSLLITSVLIFISVNAKSVKEAQSNMAILTMLPSVLSLLVMFSPMSGLSLWSMALPIYNVIVCLKMIFANTLSGGMIAVMLLSQLLLVAIINFFSWRAVRNNKFLL